MAEYFSYGEQSLHYFARPHTGPAPGPVESTAAWRGSDLAGTDVWRHALSDEEIAEFDAALDHAEAAGRPTANLATADFPLDQTVSLIATWRRQLAHGRGFQVISGVPVERWSRERTELFFWGLGLHLGQPGAQNAKGDLLGHVTDTGADVADPFVRLYETRSDIAFHCDAADVVGLLCLSAGRSGGASRIASSVAVHNELMRQRPDLVARLYLPFHLDLRNEDKSGALRHIKIQPCCHANGELRTFYHSDYFRSAVRHADVPAFTTEETELLDLYEAIAGSAEFRLDMQLAPGDVQLLSNHAIVHARTAYEDDPARAAGPRHLLRLWLSIDPK